MRSFLLALPFLLPGMAHAQASLDSLMNLADAAAPRHEPVQATFKDTRLINFHTVEVAGRRTLDFRISHRFGNINGGASEFFGLDGPASIRIALEYSLTDRLEFGLGRSNVNKLIDGFVKYRLFRQMSGGGWPVSITALAGANVSALSQAAIPADQRRYTDMADRLSYTYQVMIARKFTPSISAQLSPTLVHTNLVEGMSDRNDVYAVVGLARWKFTHRMAITGEYALRLSGATPGLYTGADMSHNAAAIGLEIETGGHVFSMHFSNAFGLNEAQVIPYTADSWLKGGIKLGFNISRVFTL